MHRQHPDFISVFNDVLGPVMRGPSSSHTAGSHRIGLISRDLLGEAPAEAVFTFGENRSYAQVYKEQGVDCALAAGLMGWDLTDERFSKSLDHAHQNGIKLVFKTGVLKDTHPNAVNIRLRSQNRVTLDLKAKSIGGGAVRFTSLNRWPVDLDGKAYVLFCECQKQNQHRILDLFDSQSHMEVDSFSKQGKSLLCLKTNSPFEKKQMRELHSLLNPGKVWSCSPVFFTRRGKELFLNGAEMLESARKNGKSLGQLALDYESRLLGFSLSETLEEMSRRQQVMWDSVAAGLQNQNCQMKLLNPSAENIMKKEAGKNLLVGGVHLRAAARAMAVMHVTNSGGVVCAAPTGGSAGVLPGVALTLEQDLNGDEKTVKKGLFAAGAVGLAIARRATFAAEEAGCQAEIGAAGAMAAAMVVESAGGSARQALDAASISLQNTMGSVCDLVQGLCEIPCHTRNAVAASNAFLCADLIMGGYENPVSFDDTVDALYSVGKMLPQELRCTSKGGIATAPSARSIPKKR
ncbi:MAG: hypothetical protein GF421_05085 [Candidatus Aminicenantes bacterium]|nr:hypothetical protein [Candidatus Aminicenantes bacterium]